MTLRYRYFLSPVLCVLMVGCMSGGSSRIPVPPPEYYAIQDYKRIASNANLLLSTDWMNWVPGRTEPERVSVECKGMYCSVGYSHFLRSNRVVSIDTEELMVLPDTNGISTAVENFSGKFLDAHNHGGWMEYSFFASRAAIFTSDTDPDQGVIQVFATVTGSAPLTNPEMEATWAGFVSARDDTAGTHRDSYVTGDASISVSIGAQVLADVYLTGMANVTTGQTYADVTYENLVVTDGQFSRRHADNERLSGVFYGPGHEEVGGVFEAPQGLLGAYGGAKQ
ncbi:MAG: hypothetical protein OXI37_08040 [Gammaproteobacteria bacterium]|nr:hypothetical protein [Gammaproteobacteria bacterium]